MMAGGGLDIRIIKHILYRLFNADYFLSRPTSLISGGDVNKNNVRLTTGINPRLSPQNRPYVITSKPANGLHSGH